MIAPTAHTLTAFDDALGETRAEVLTMGSKALQNLENALLGLITRNADQCNEVIADDDDVDALETTIDKIGLEILTRFTPVAGDLRQVLAALKISSNIERISDMATSIAKRARKILKYPEIPETRVIEPIFEAALSMARDSLRAYAEGDVDLSLALYERDRELNAIHKQAIKKLTKSIETDTVNLKPLLHLIFIIRALERVGDHSVNIAEDTFFMVRAEPLRHFGPKNYLPSADDEGP